MTKTMIYAFAVILLAGKISPMKVNKGSSTFRAAVYEHTVHEVILNSRNPTAGDIWKALSVNIDPLTNAALEAKKQGADIIVFPEYGVTGLGWGKRSQFYPLLEDIPDSESHAIPCNSFPKKTIQNWLSCLAKENKMYIAANVGDLKKCTSEDPDCPPDGAYQYNTNVVYDQNGMLVHRYHKINLFGSEPNFLNYGKFGQKNLVFDTPVGRMSSMICFDILFEEPGVPLTSAGKIDTMLFPTAWMNVFPHFVGIQYHSSWAMRHNVNMLAAEIHLPIVRMTGSGLYSPTGAVSYTYDMETYKPKLLVSDLSIKPKRIAMKQKLEQLKWANPQFSTKDFNFVALTGTSGKKRVCKGNICCKAEYSFSKGVLVRELYALGAYYDLPYSKNGSLEICVILKCAQKKIEGCGKFVSDTSATFYSIVLSGNFSSDQVYPSASLTGLKMAQEGQFNMTTIGKVSTRISGLPVVTMVLLGRNYHAKPTLSSKITGSKYSESHLIRKSFL